jgi:hypothetical protein
MGATDLDLVDFLLYATKHRMMRLIGPRGAGKTTMIHFAEAAIKQSGLEHAPKLVVLDGLRCPADATYEDLVAMIRDGMRESAEDNDLGIADVFLDASRALDRQLAFGSVGQVFAELRGRLPRRDEKLVTIIFDNLDQLRPIAITRIVELAKSIYLNSRIGSVLCFRPGSESYVSKTSIASAFFFYRMEVQTPRLDSWFESLIPRIIQTIKAEFAQKGHLLEVEGISITPELMQNVFSRLLSLLREQRRSDDDVFHVLETVSANDTRHLVRLFRRLLRSSNLPYRWLLNVDPEKPVFHPLTSLITGSKLFYAHSPDLPNLLYFTADAIGTDLLLPHRILRLLASSRNSIETERLLQWIVQFREYDTNSIIKCLGMLLEAHVIGATDGEQISLDEPLPSGVFLTEAGRYYIESLLSYTDYLTSVIVDVPLEHSALKDRQHDTFVARLHSLIEYAREVKDAESRQLRNLARHATGPELARVVQALSNGGLLTHSLHKGLSDALHRGRSSRSQPLIEALPLVETVVAELDTWLLSTERGLGELRNKAGRSFPIPAQPLLLGEEGVEAQLDVRTVGEDLQMSVQVRGEVTGTTFVAVTAPASAGGDFIQATPVGQRLPAVTDSPERGRQGLLKGEFPDVSPGFALTKEQIRVQVLTAPSSVDRVGLLSIDEDNGKARVRLYTGHESDANLGSAQSMEGLRSWAREQLETISALIAAGEDFQDHLRAIGTEFCDRALSADGARKLASSYGLLDTIVLCCNEPEIPWELLCPPPTETEMLPSIGDTWRVFRWPTDPIGGAIKYQISDPRARAGTLRTLGISTEAGGNGHVSPPPESLKDVANVLSASDSVHLIGHWDEGRLSFDGSRYKLDAQFVRSTPMPGARNVVISSCGAGAVDKSANLPIALSSKSSGKRVVWSPIVKIREQDALQIDSYLSSFSKAYPDMPMEQLMREGRSTLPILALYVRYGLSRA